jgi:hypothetical protein
MSARDITAVGKCDTTRAVTTADRKFHPRELQEDAAAVSKLGEREMIAAHEALLAGSVSTCFLKVFLIQVIARDGVECCNVVCPIVLPTVTNGGMP